MAGQLVILMLLLPSLLLVAGAGAAAAGSPEEGCIATTSLITSTLQDEMDLWVCRHGRDVVVTVHHSQGSCTIGITDSDMDFHWLHAKLNLKDTIVLFANGIPFAPRSGCVESVKRNSIKTVSVDNGNNPVLPACRQGPAIYQISKDSEDVLVPWYGEEAQLVLEPQDDTNITIQVGGQEFVVCNDGTHVAAQQDASACTAGVDTSAITLTIPKSNTVIKVTTADGKETVTAVSNGAAGVPPTVKKTSITGTVIMKQCMPHCTTQQHVPHHSSGTVYMALMVVSMVISAVLGAALIYLVVRARKGVTRLEEQGDKPIDPLCPSLLTVPERGSSKKIANGHC